MAIKRITISVPEKLAKKIKKASGDRPVSSWVTKLIEDHLDEQAAERVWEAFYADVAPSEKDKRDAEALFERLTTPPRGSSGRRRGAA